MFRHSLRESKKTTCEEGIEMKKTFSQIEGMEPEY
jgi:hypothetical protein